MSPLAQDLHKRPNTGTCKTSDSRFLKFYKFWGHSCCTRCAVRFRRVGVDLLGAETAFGMVENGVGLCNLVFGSKPKPKLKPSNN